MSKCDYIFNAKIKRVYVYHFQVSRGNYKFLYGEVRNGMQGKVHQLFLQVAFVEITEQGLVGKLYDCFKQPTWGLVLKKHYQRTKTDEGEKSSHKMFILSTMIQIKICSTI